MATIKKEKVSKAKKQFDLNIDPQLFQAWKTYTRMGDSVRIANKYKRSRPTIDNALNFGHVQNTELVGQITTFFTDRLKDERNQAEQLKSASVINQ